MEEIRKAFHIKMNFKNLEFEGIHQMMNECNEKQVKAGWQNSLAHQIPRGITILRRGEAGIIRTPD